MSFLPSWAQFALDAVAAVNDDLDEEIDCWRHSPNREKREVEWQQGEDPYGLDWEWVLPAEEVVDNSTIASKCIRAGLEPNSN